MPDIFVAGDLPPKHTMNYSTSTRKKTKHPRVTRHKHFTDDQKKQLEGYHTNPLSAFCYYPSHVKFVGADKQEKIVLLLRRHPITNLGWIIIAILMLFVPLVFSFVPTISAFPIGMQITLLLFWYLITFAFILEEFLSWFFNVYIVTDERVFDVDFHNLVYREITDANLDQIQDVTVRVGSVLRTVFDFGDVFIQTASEKPQIEFEAVPNPDRVTEVLRELRVEEEIEKIEGRVR